jgi:(4S)-4-hydroxy-5-phosphonooxypentane-2,3-dione isomerase
MSVVLVVRMNAQEGKEDDLAAALRELADASRQESGCELYIPTRHAEDPRSFLLYEQYVDKEAVDAHAASEHFQRIAVGGFPSLLDGPRKRTFYETL